MARRRSAWTAMLLAAAAPAVPDGPLAVARALAQTETGAGAVPSPGQRRFTIPPQPLADALALFGQQSGWQVSAHGALVEGVGTPGVSGVMTPERALRRLLAGTGLLHAITSGNTVVLHRLTAQAPGDRAVSLAPVTVEGSEDAARGPLHGHLAARSVTATKTDTPLTRIPQALSVIPRRQMEDQNVKSVAQSLRYSSGVFAEYRGSSNLHDETFIRGFGYAPRVLDGLGYGSGSIGQIDPWLLERVEVLRGPSSMLYGQTNPGGLIGLVSKRPLAKPAREVRVEFGGNGRLGGAFDVGGPATADGSLLYRLVGLGQRFDADEDFAKQERVVLAPSLTWRPGERTELTLLANHHHDPEAGFRNFLPSVGTVREGSLGHGRLPRGFFVSDPGFQRSRRAQSSVGYRFEHRPDEALTLRQNARHTRLRSDYDTLSLAALQPDQVTLTRNASADRERVTQFAIDSQIEAALEAGPLDHTLLLGLDHRRTGTDSYIRRGPAPAIDWRAPVYHVAIGPMAATSDQHAIASQTGLYLQDQIALDRLTVLLGLRHDRTRTRIANRIGADSGRKDGTFSHRAGAIYSFDSGVAPYVSLSTSFEPELSGGAPGTAPFQPTTGRQAEAGVKIQPKGWGVLFTAALFDLRQRNVVTYDAATGYNVQVGEVHSRGVEMEARGALTPALSVIASYSHVDAEVTRTSIPAAFGKTPARIPGHQAGLWLEYAGEDDGAFDGLTLGGGARYIGASFGNAQNSFTVPAVTLFDAALRYELGRLSGRLEGASLRINASNLTDRLFVASCAGLDSCFYGAGRTVTAGLAYRW